MCNCGGGGKITWAEACRRIQSQMKKKAVDNVHFHPQTIVDCRPHKIATGHKTCCFTIHVDGLNVRHHKVKGTAYTTFGVQIHGHVTFCFFFWKKNQIQESEKT